MSRYKYAMGGETGGPIEERVEEMKSKIKSALEGGASDKEIMMMVQDSGLQDKYEFNWDNVEMKVEAYPIEGGSEGRGAEGGIGALLSKLKEARGAAQDDRFGPSDAPGQRGDMFEGGGNTQTTGKSADQKIKEYESILNRTGVSEEARQKYSDLIKKIRASEKMEKGGRTFQYGSSDDQGGRADQGGPRRTSSEALSPVLYDENDRPYVLNWMDVEKAGLGGNSDTFDISFDYGHAKKFEEGGVPRIYIEGDLVDQIKLNEGMGRLMLPTAMDFNVSKSNGRDVLQVRQ